VSKIGRWLCLRLVLTLGTNKEPSIVLVLHLYCLPIRLVTTQMGYVLVFLLLEVSDAWYAWFNLLVLVKIPAPVGFPVEKKSCWTGQAYLFFSIWVFTRQSISTGSI
jgi:hypothetical protein